MSVSRTAPTDRRRSPRARFRVGDLVMANGKAPGLYRHRRGRIVGVVDGRAEFDVEFEDARRPSGGRLKAGWLNL